MPGRGRRIRSRNRGSRQENNTPAPDRPGCDRERRDPALLCGKICPLWGSAGKDSRKHATRRHQQGHFSRGRTRWRAPIEVVLAPMPCGRGGARRPLRDFWSRTPVRQRAGGCGFGLAILCMRPRRGEGSRTDSPRRECDGAKQSPRRNARHRRPRDPVATTGPGHREPTLGEDLPRCRLRVRQGNGSRSRTQSLLRVRRRSRSLPTVVPHQ